jgi:hypothetical protein
MWKYGLSSTKTKRENVDWVQPNPNVKIWTEFNLNQTWKYGLSLTKTRCESVDRVQPKPDVKLYTASNLPGVQWQAVFKVKQNLAVM